MREKKKKKRDIEIKRKEKTGDNNYRLNRQFKLYY